ncbi:MAG TPA: ATP-dependent Clp protease adaptor ClpS [Planctomycetota bacterium]|nr:ATP-dependent Clp protease adaptor ClpS [Planctomycetota bacterium]
MAAPPVAPAPEKVEETRTDEQLAPLYKVLIHNDDITPFGFVMTVLREIFKLGLARAFAITLEAHNRGVALVVVEPREHAEFHVEQAHSLARGRNYPLNFSIEPA